MTKGEVFGFCVVFIIAFAVLACGIILGSAAGMFIGAGGLILALGALFSRLSQKRA